MGVRHSSKRYDCRRYVKRLMHRHIRRNKTDSNKAQVLIREYKKGKIIDDIEYRLFETHHSKPKYKNINRETIRRCEYE